MLNFASLVQQLLFIELTNGVSSSSSFATTAVLFLAYYTFTLRKVSKVLKREIYAEDSKDGFGLCERPATLSFYFFHLPSFVCISLLSINLLVNVPNSSLG